MVTATPIPMPSTQEQLTETKPVQTLVTLVRFELERKHIKPHERGERIPLSRGLDCY